jgi:2-(1,2-epoxy-1,2-dihydrophenyl)acetyl-CoA isomerase
MPTTPSIRVEMQAGLAIVTLAEAARGNPFDDTFTRDFKQVFGDLWDATGSSGGLRAVLLRAEGKNFSFGGDLKAFGPEIANLGPLVRRWTADLHMGLQRAWKLPVPVVAAVQGYAMGGGAALVAGCDVVVAGESARIGSAFTKIGFSCDSGSTITLTARMGAARARRFVLLAEILNAQEAEKVGLFDKVVPDDRLQAEALKLAQELAQGPTVAYGEVKRLFMKVGAAQLESQLEDEALTLGRVSGTADAQEGVTAMGEKRKPKFMGR